MIPLGDADRRPLHFPIITATIIVVNVLVFALELAGGETLVTQWALVPADVASGQNWITILTSMFMHGGWLHILGNMLFLWVFGPAIEDVMGPISYLVFYLMGGFAAIVTQVVVWPSSTVPALGASGAIAAVMGAFVITYPRDQIRTVLLLGWFSRVTFVPAIVLVGVWFLTQLFSQVSSFLGQVRIDGVAYMAHIGGFAFGALLGRLFETSERRQQQGLR